MKARLNLELVDGKQYFGETHDVEDRFVPVLSEMFAEVPNRGTDFRYAGLSPEEKRCDSAPDPKDLTELRQLRSKTVADLVFHSSLHDIHVIMDKIVHDYKLEDDPSLKVSTRKSNGLKCIGLAVADETEEVKPWKLKRMSVQVTWTPEFDEFYDFDFMRLTDDNKPTSECFISHR